MRKGNIQIIDMKLVTDKKKADLVQLSYTWVGGRWGFELVNFWLFHLESTIKPTFSFSQDQLGQLSLKNVANSYTEMRQRQKVTFSDYILR
jgi:hypothetical protein